MQHEDPVPVRERTRRTVRAELTMLAQDLFAANGYDECTIDDLAAAAGMSRRTFFRYFTSKEDLLLGKYDLMADRLAADLSARPPQEPLWESLRRTFDSVAGYYDDKKNRTRALAMEKIIHGNPALLAGELERLSRIQARLVEVIHGRTGEPAPDDPRPAAIVGAAVSCLVAAKATWIASNQARPFADLLDETMAALTPS